MASKNSLLSATELCSADQTPLLVIAKDEWSSYFLRQCEQAYFFYDRRTSFKRLQGMVRQNKLRSLTQNCHSNQLKIIGKIPQGYNRILLDSCFQLDDQTYSRIRDYGIYTYYEKNN